MGKVFLMGGRILLLALFIKKKLFVLMLFCCCLFCVSVYLFCCECLLVHVGGEGGVEDAVSIVLSLV